jgi:hypothetical protein
VKYISPNKKPILSIWTSPPHPEHSPVSACTPNKILSEEARLAPMPKFLPILMVIVLNNCYNQKIVNLFQAHLVTT